MSEYTNVEHPFLEKLREIKWQVIDKGSGGGYILIHSVASSFEKLYFCIIVK